MRIFSSPMSKQRQLKRYSRALFQILVLKLSFLRILYKNSDKFLHFTPKPWDPLKTLGVTSKPWEQPPLPRSGGVIGKLPGGGKGGKYPGGANGENCQGCRGGNNLHRGALPLLLHIYSPPLCT